MLVIGASLVANVPGARSFPGMILRDYVNNGIQLAVDDSSNFVVYSFGLNDLLSGESTSNLFRNYNKLRRGKKTILIIPPLQPTDFVLEMMVSDILDSDFELIACWCDDTVYHTTDGLHPNDHSVQVLIDALKDVEPK